MKKQDFRVEAKDAFTNLVVGALQMGIRKEVMEICASLGEILILCIEDRCLTEAEAEIVKRIIPPILDLRAEFSANAETTISNWRESHSPRDPEA